MLNFINRIIKRKQKVKTVSTINEEGKSMSVFERNKHNFTALDQETINNAFLTYVQFSLELPNIEHINRSLRDLIRCVKKGRYLNDGALYTFDVTTFTNETFFHTEEGRVSLRVHSLVELRAKLIELLTAIEQVKATDVNSPTREYYERILNNFVRQFDVLIQVIRYQG